MNIKNVLPLSIAVSIVAFGAISCGGKATTAVPAAASAPAAHSPPPVQVQGTQKADPQWLDDAYRKANYPQNLWFVGFSQNDVRGTNIASALQSVEADAQNKMAESITLHISSAARNERISISAMDNANLREVIGRTYGQIINTSTSATVAKIEQYSYHDTQNDKVHAFAAVKMSTLADYYANMIESGLREAEGALELADQARELGKKKNEYIGRLTEAQKRIESLALYRDLLITVDSEKGLERTQGGRANELLKRIVIELGKADDIMSVFVTGTETIQGTAAEIIIPGLVTTLNQNGCRIVGGRDEAYYILAISAKDHNQKYDGRHYHSESSVKVTLTNVKTGKDEITTTVIGPKEGARDIKLAAERAFMAVVPEIWDKVKEKLMVD